MVDLAWGSVARSIGVSRYTCLNWRSIISGFTGVIFTIFSTRVTSTTFAMGGGASPRLAIGYVLLLFARGDSATLGELHARLCHARISSYSWLTGNGLFIYLFSAESSWHRYFVWQHRLPASVVLSSPSMMRSSTSTPSSPVAAAAAAAAAAIATFIVIVQLSPTAANDISTYDAYLLRGFLVWWL